MLKLALFLSAAVALLLFATIAIPTPAMMGAMMQTPAADIPAGTANPVKPTPASQARAKKIYATDCAMCHGDNGNGKSDIATAMHVTLDDWTDPKSLAGKTDAQLFNTIRNGSGTAAAAMPPETANRAHDAEVWNLIIYIRSLSKH